MPLEECTDLKLSDFDYELPEERIAQQAVEPRDAARLLVYRRSTDEVWHAHVRDLPEWLDANDLLVVNDTRVLPARLFARRESGGQVELLFAEPGEGAEGEDPEEAFPEVWRVLARPARKLKAGELLRTPGGLVVQILGREKSRAAEQATLRVHLIDPTKPYAAVADLLEREGHMPLPPYIRRARGVEQAQEPGEREQAELDRRLYQTVYARESGAVAAPTAGLHLTERLLEELEQRGVQRASVTLHVGLGTFRPVTAEDPRQHPMHAERFHVPVETARAVKACRAAGARVVAVGTTSLRSLESCVDDTGEVCPGSGSTRLFLYPESDEGPGSKIIGADALLTNFHLPRSTLLMLVACLVGRERLLDLYRQAIESGYRFYSYGDAMLILP